MEPMTWAHASLWIAGAVAVACMAVGACFLAITKSYNAIIRTQQTEMNYMQGSINLLRAEMVNERRMCDERLARMGQRIGELEKLSGIQRGDK